VVISEIKKDTAESVNDNPVLCCLVAVMAVKRDDTGDGLRML
jgi:hypothetical protein